MGGGGERQSDQNSEKEVIGYKDPSNEVCVWRGSFQGCGGWSFHIPCMRLTKLPCLCGEGMGSGHGSSCI